MKKRVMSLLLVMLMVFALLPAAAMAADEPSVAVEDGGVNITKTLAMQPNGDYTITLESWSTGAKHTETVTDALPTDIVLVLDQSGSMDEEIQSDPTEQDKVPSVTYSQVSNGKYYIKVDGQFYRLQTEYVDHWFSSDEYYIYYATARNDVVLAEGDNNRISYSADNLYKASSTTTTRLEALKTAVNSFLAVVAAQKDTAGNRVTHRVAIVGFASDGAIYNSDWFTDYKWENTEIFNGASQTQYDSSSIDTAASTALKETDADGLTTLGQSIAALDASGATCSDKGLKLAQKILDARSDADKASRGSAVLLFTDGRPGSGKGESNQETYAGYAVSAAYDLKHAKDYSAYVFTVGVFDEADTNKLNNTYTIRQYMQAVSSDYPDAKGMSDAASTTVTPKYYQTAENTAALSEVFRTFAEEISVPTTEVTLDAGSYLSDVINGSDFKVSEARPATVTAKAVKFSDGSEDTAVTANLKYEKILPSSGEVKVSGFDYSTLYHIEGDAEHDGDKLVVTISGLVPTKSGPLKSNSSAGIFAKEGEQIASVNLPKSPSTSIAKESFIIDFNTKMVLAENASRLNATRTVNGAFDLVSGLLTYQLKPTETLGDYSASLIMNGVDTAMAFNGTAWKEYQTIPANNIYFDDALLNKTVTVGDGSGYNSGVTTAASQAVTDVADKSVLLYTFRGTGIDIYCTTNADGGYIQAGLMSGTAETATGKDLVFFENAEGHYYKDANGAYIHIEKDTVVPEGAKRYDSSLLAVRNYSITPDKADRYNVPTVSYTGLPYGTYTVRINSLEGANYKLDGIRVYNAMADNEAVYAGTNEANAHFYNLREALVNDGQNVVVKKQDETSKLDVYLEGQASAALPGVLFIDNKDSVKLEKTVVDAQGNFVLDENGQPKKELVYKDAFSAYVANGPKNEIYLAKGQGVAFTISDAAKGDHYWIGLSVPDQGSASASVAVNGEALTPSVASAVDMYYPITPNASGTVVIVNNGDAMVSVTNLKVTKASADGTNDTGAAPFAVLESESLDIAARTVQNDGAGQSLQEMVRQLISNFVSVLFNNIARMFGK